MSVMTMKTDQVIAKTWQDRLGKSTLPHVAPLYLQKAKIHKQPSHPFGNVAQSLLLKCTTCIRHVVRVVTTEDWAELRTWLITADSKSRWPRGRKASVPASDAYSGVVVGGGGGRDRGEGVGRGRTRYRLYCFEYGNAWSVLGRVRNYSTFA